jgi:hypothetical protein
MKKENAVRDKFTEALRQLGHIYEPRSKGITVGHQVRHIAKLFVPTGEVQPICGAEDYTRELCCPALYLDSNCERCREIERLPQAITKRSLMLDLTNVMCDIEQTFLDAMYWNFHNRDEAPINPDPDGELAKTWLEYKMQINSMMARFEPTLKRHEGRFGWPTEFGETESK